MPVIPLIELLSEGLLYFRKVLAIYNAYGQVREIFKFKESVPTAELRFHKSIPGEEAYFFILGRELLYRLLNGEDATIDDIDYITLVAIKKYVATHSGSDVDTCVTEFGYVLGQVAQNYFPSFAETCRGYLDGGSGKFELEDPVLAVIKNPQHEMPAPSILIDLGISDDAWSALANSTTLSSLGQEWEQALFGLPDSVKNIHKAHTFIGLMLRGAISVLFEPILEVPILGGPHSLALNMFALMKPQPLPVVRFKLRQDRGITAEMVNSYSLEVTMTKGLIPMKDRRWLPIDQVTYDAELGEYKPISSNISQNMSLGSTDTKDFNYAEPVIEGVTHALSKLAGGKLSSFITLFNQARKLID